MSNSFTTRAYVHLRAKNVQMLSVLEYWFEEAEPILTVTDDEDNKKEQIGQKRTNTVEDITMVKIVPFPRRWIPPGRWITINGLLSNALQKIIEAAILDL
ncbi:hypothetical protein CEXT_564521 [Caerostris extrusa]|uniref:Uncharacterized protein n=1 Tax=Caerostris extrusa TaxID=172846 RepID=A0AAV4R5P5_CAEEX|nr:hypothetical protein CEXT_564521 [Caerostris extrusa]